MARSRSTIFSRWVPSRCRASLSVSRTSPRGSIASSIWPNRSASGAGPTIRAIPPIPIPLLAASAAGQLGIVGGLQPAPGGRADAQVPHLALVDDVDLARLLPLQQQPGQLPLGVKAAEPLHLHVAGVPGAVRAGEHGGVAERAQPVLMLDAPDQAGHPPPARAGGRPPGRAGVTPRRAVGARRSGRACRRPQSRARPASPAACSRY